MWSVGSGKMLGIPSLNTDTVTNDFCKSMYNSKVENLICRSCYSMSMLKTFRKNYIKPLASRIGYKYDEDNDFEHMIDTSEISSKRVFTV